MLLSARGAKGLKQWEVARTAGIAASRLSALEHGTQPVGPGDARKLAPVLGLDAAELLRAPRPERRRPTVTAMPAVTAKSFKDIAATCPCDWEMTFARRKPSGWKLARVKRGCLHHWGGAVSATRYAGHLTWAQTRRAAAVLRAAQQAPGRRREDVAAELGWSTSKVHMAVNAITRMTPADALALAAALGADPAGLGLPGGTA